MASDETTPSHSSNSPHTTFSTTCTTAQGLWSSPTPSVCSVRKSQDLLLSESPTYPGPLYDPVQLEIEITKRTQRVPRYLFRFWTSEAAGQGQVGQLKANSQQRVKPLWFLIHPEFERLRLFDISPDDIWRTADSHLIGDTKTISYFSSWTQSLPLALAWAKEYEDDPDLHLCIIDTATLPDHTTIINAKELGTVFEEKWQNFNHVYLAYGEISGPRSYSCVSWKDLRRCGLDWFLAARIDPVHAQAGIANNGQRSTSTTASLPCSWEERLPIAFQLGSLFGWRFSSAVVVHLMTIFPEDLEHFHDIAIAVSKAPHIIAVVTDLHQHNIDTEHHGHLEALYAARLCARIWQLVYGRGRVLRAGINQNYTNEQVKRQMDNALTALKESGAVPDTVCERYDKLTRRENNDYDRLAASKSKKKRKKKIVVSDEDNDCVKVICPVC